jgi:hypothetical protein
MGGRTVRVTPFIFCMVNIAFAFVPHKLADEICIKDPDSDHAS